MSHFGHMVFFTLKDSSDEKQQGLIDAAKKYLSDHPGTIHFSVGRLADKNRDVNDRDFHVALHVVFDSVQAQDAYQVDERHSAFIEEQKENWSQVRVFDSDLA